MKQSFRTALLIASALLMMFGAVGDSFIIVPDLHGDLIEIGVRPTVVGGTVLHLYFGALARFGFALMVSAAAIQALRGVAPARMPLAVVAVLIVIKALDSGLNTSLHRSADSAFFNLIVGRDVVALQGMIKKNDG
jgi:hypothetical protein